MTETRVTSDGLRRRRVCTACKRRFTTYEKVGAPSLKVAKRDGELEPFDGDKLFRSLQRVASHRRSVHEEDLHRIARDIEATLVDSGRKSIPWHEIVALALARLRNIDPISEQRLAANYTDESGAVRLADPAPAVESSQLGLPLSDDD